MGKSLKASVLCLGLLFALPVYAQGILPGVLSPVSAKPQSGTPSFSPGAGTYTGTQSVTISATGGSVICYNTTGSPATNGSTGCATGTLYTGAVSVSTSETLYAVSGGTGYTDSSVGSAAYTINCTGLPSYQAQYLGTSPSAGSVSSWADSTGNGHTVMMSGTDPVAGVTTATPNGTQTVLTTGASLGTLSALPAPSALSICAVFKSSTTTPIGQGISAGPTSGPAYYINVQSPLTDQLWAVNGVGNGGYGSGSPTTSWVDNCFSYTVGGAWTLYHNGTSEGSGTSSLTFTNGIEYILGDGIGDNFYGAVAEIDIMNVAITSTQTTAIHNCAVSRYGVL